jgi:uncharacterized protein YbbC (DUF1343 family)
MSAVQTGSDAMAASSFDNLAGMRVGFVGNHTSRLSDGTATHVAMRDSGAETLVKLFSPEHGAFGREDCEGIGDDVDPATGLPILSLYGETRKPTPAMMAGLDALVFELQDVGARFYTYASTMLLCMEAAHAAGIAFIVLDRPNPITGLHAEGPLADRDRLSFTACHSIPVRHGLTLGELARLAAVERQHGEKVTVIPCRGWNRSMWWDETGIPWISPSPAMDSLATATVYPGVCLLEQTNVSVGRGTDTPFLVAGAPWIDADHWSASIANSCGPGISVEPHTFTPAISKFEGEKCHGVRLRVTDRDKLQTIRLGFAMIASLRDIHGNEFDLDGVDRLLVNRATMDRLRSGETADSICDSCKSSLSEWRLRTKPHHLYSHDNI